MFYKMEEYKEKSIAFESQWFARKEVDSSFIRHMTLNTCRQSK